MAAWYGIPCIGDTLFKLLHVRTCSLGALANIYLQYCKWGEAKEGPRCGYSYRVIVWSHLITVCVIHAGALYCDGGLRTKGFTGEGIRGSSVLVVKDHGAGTPLFSNNQLPRRILDDKPVYGGAILLVRNLRNSLIAEWHRERSKRENSRTASNHFLYVGAENFGECTFHTCFGTAP